MTDDQSSDNPPSAPSGGKGDTTDYSASKAPETRREAEERESTPDARLIPGGAHASPSDVGMSGMDREDVPSRAAKPEQLKAGDSPKGTA
jgi:hypothetical protein